jgi:CO/xanthine dehydrogenase Mo-binding subunit
MTPKCKPRFLVFTCFSAISYLLRSPYRCFLVGSYSDPNHDFAEYHIATNADVGTIDVTWIDEEDPHVNPMGAKGIGEIGIVGTAAAIANAVNHATGIHVRDLPITLEKLLP